jgi:shikimate kinase
MDKIILLGYMGSGKSTIAKLLAQMQGLPFKDLDAIIERRENSSIKDIFDQKGEIYFRKLEHMILRELLASSEDFVLSLGGGTPCYANNHELLNGQGIVSVYLKASLNELYKRLQPHKTDRPLIAAMDDNEMQEFIAKHLFERSFFYSQALHSVSVDGKSPKAIATEIARLF